MGGVDLALPDADALIVHTIYLAGKVGRDEKGKVAPGVLIEIDGIAVISQ